jgi:hypothetical protein
VTRKALLVALLGAIASLTPGSLATAASTTSVVVAKGTGTLVLTIGGGTAFGQLRAEGSSITVLDLSPTHDLSVITSVSPTLDPVTGMQTFQPEPGRRALPFRITGTYYVLTVHGTSNTNAVGVYGRVQALGAGWLTVDGGPRKAWKGKLIKLAPIPATLRAVRVPATSPVQ